MKMRVAMWIGRYTAVLCAAGALGGCGGGGPILAPAQCPTVASAFPPALIFPAANATNVPDGNFTLVVQNGTPPLGGTPFAQALLVPATSNVPTVNVTTFGEVSGTSGTQFGASVGSLAAHEQYQLVFVEGALPSGCPPIEAASASFTTQ